MVRVESNKVIEVAVCDPPQGGVCFDHHEAALAYARRIRDELYRQRRTSFTSVEEMYRTVPVQLSEPPVQPEEPWW